MISESNRLLVELRDSLIEALEKTREAERIGGFVFLKDASQTMVWMNQTIPNGPCTKSDLDRLLARYAEVDRSPFFEFFRELSPEVPALLADAGLKLRAEMPIMILEKSGWSPSSYEDRARVPDLNELEAGVRVANLAFGGEELSPGAVERLRASMESGQTLVSVAFSCDEIVAMGQGIGTNRIREIAGIGTLPTHRRQGFAKAVIQCLLDQFFGNQGEIAWLTPGDDGARSLYEGLGFKPVGTQVCFEA